MTPDVLPGDLILRAIGPSLIEIAREDIDEFTIEEHSSLALQASTEDGFKYSVDSRKAKVAFQHKLRALAVSGGPPIMELITQPQPYTTLLDECARRLTAIVSALPAQGNRKLVRVGVVSQTHVDEADLPPGIRQIIAHHEKPWDEPLEHYSLQFGVPLARVEGHWDRCVHTLVKPDDPKKLMTLQFDWQRTFTTPGRLDRRSLEASFAQCATDALAYFEAIAEGGRYDA